MEGLYSFFVAQSFRALARLIMTSAQGPGYFQHANTITQKQHSTNVLWLRVCVYPRNKGQEVVNKEQKELKMGGMEERR